VGNIYIHIYIYIYIYIEREREREREREARAESCVKLNMNLVDNLLYFLMLDLIILSRIHTCKNKLNYLEYP